MMADLSTLDDTVPPKSEKISLGDDRIRETREAIIASFGTLAGVGPATSEHYLKGAHKIPRGGPGARPPVENLGRIYINTTDEWFEVDNGSNFDQLHTVGSKVAYTGQVAIPIGIFGTMASLPFKVRGDNAVFICVQFNVVPSTHSILVESTALIDGSSMGMVPDITSHRTQNAGDPSTGMVLFQYVGVPIPAGPHVAEFQLRTYAVNTNCIQVMMGILVV
jgi:hypothetical protein